MSKAVTIVVVMSTYISRDCHSASFCTLSLGRQRLYWKKFNCNSNLSRFPDYRQSSCRWAKDTFFRYGNRSVT